MYTRTQLFPSSLSHTVGRPEQVSTPPCSWRDAVPVLTGEHCALRELQADDAQPLVSILTAPEVTRFMSPPPTTVEQFAWFIEWSRREREAGRYLAFALIPHAHASPVGLLQLRQLEPEFRTAEWGVAMAPRPPLAGEAPEVEARAALANGRSQAAMRKLGAVKEGVLRRSLTTGDGQRLDQVLWSLLDEDWRRLTDQPDIVLVH